MTSEYETWRNKFKRTKKGKAALFLRGDDLAKHGSLKDFEILRDQILWECYQAHQYNENQIRKLHQKKRDYKALVADQIKAIKAVSMFASKYPGESVFAFSAASAELKK